MWRDAIFYQNRQSKHAVLRATSLPLHHRAHVHFTESVRRQNVFTMAALEANNDIGLMSGTISIPDCNAVKSNMRIVHGSEDLFAMSCPLSRPEAPNGEQGLRLVGAAVFNMKGLVIGTVDRIDPYSFDIKYSRKTSSFLKTWERSLKDIDDTISLSKGPDRGFTKGAGTSRHGGSSAGLASKKRGRDDTPSGGTSTKICLSLNQLTINVEVRSEVNLRLHRIPLQGDVDVGRREAMRRELVKLVTRESDDRWTGSPSSPGCKASGDAEAAESVPPGDGLAFQADNAYRYSDPGCGATTPCGTSQGGQAIAGRF